MTVAPLATKPYTPMPSAAGAATRFVSGVTSRNGSEHREQHREHTELGGQRNREWLAHESRPRYPTGEDRTRERDARARAAREREPDRVQQERIEHEQHRDREGEDAYS